MYWRLRWSRGSVLAFGALRYVKEPKSDVEVATFGKIISAISRP
jgi:hypothetical protein